jgi:hypothetical protein
LAMVLKAQDTDPRDKALEIISKNDNKLYHEILKAARGMKPAKSIKKPNPKKLMAQYEEVELEEEFNDSHAKEVAHGIAKKLGKDHVVTKHDHGEFHDGKTTYQVHHKSYSSSEAKEDGAPGHFVTAHKKHIEVNHDTHGEGGGETTHKSVDHAIKHGGSMNEDYKQDAKNAPFKADPEKKKKQKNSDGTETSPMSKAKQLAKKGLVSEAEMTPAQKRKREEIVLSMKDKKDYFERKYGDRAKDVMYATATKMAMKEGFELSEETLKEFSVHTYKANQSSKKVATTKNGTNYVDGRAVGPVSDPDGGSASTPTRYSPPTKNGVSPPTQVKKEEKEIKEKVTASGTVTPSKLAARDAKNDPKSTQMGVAGAQGQGKVGMSSTSTPQPFSGTVGKKAPAGTVSPVQRLRNLLGK